MKFVVIRTSQHSYSDPERSPHPRAVRVEEIDSYGRLQGYWVIDVASLDDLLALSREGDCELVVKHAHWLREGLPVVEFYDDYRE